MQSKQNIQIPWNLDRLAQIVTAINRLDSS
jgi:hypothetical protein